MYGIKLSSPAHSFTHASMLPLPARGLGKIQGARRPPSWNLRTLIPLQGSIMRRYAILLLGHSSSFKSPLPISMRKQCPPLQWPSHVAMRLGKQRLQQLRSLSASTAAEKYVHRAVEVYRYHQDLQPQCFGQ